MASNQQKEPSPASRLSPDEQEAWRGLLVAHSLLLEAMDAELRRDQGLQISSYDVLMQLAEGPAGKLRMSELADRVLLTRSGLSRLVDSLERQGLVERVPAENDARGYYARITREGKARLRSAKRSHLRAIRERFIDKLSPEQIETLGEVWRAVLSDDATK